MSAVVQAPAVNPYVGPRAFREDEGDRFFGREHEARDLVALVLSERLVVFYAQSGAGKSSLINTRLVPGLRAEHFDVLPVARVSGAVPEGVRPENVFVFNLIARLSAEDPGSAEAPPPAAALAGMTLARFLGGEDEAGSAASETTGYATVPTVLIVDQFEEIFTTYPDQWEARADFFRQLRAAQAAFPGLWVVLTMREDFIAQLDPVAHLLPNRLQGRFYMQRMGRGAALEAIGRPAAGAGRPFAPGVAEKLVDNLRQVRSAAAAAPGGTAASGEFVEPVQLQVVCYQLWERLRGTPQHDRDGPELTEASLELVVGSRGLADFVDRALADYYEQALQAVLQPPGLDVGERELRDWFSDQLITPEGARGLVFQGRERTGGIPNAAVRRLADLFLIRAEPRGDATWYELVHDRFVQPISEANRAWRDRQSDPVSAAARLWLRNRRDPGWLLTGRLLEEAQRLAELNPRALGPDERAFLEASGRRASAEQVRANRRYRLGAFVMALLTVVAVGASGWAFQERQRAEDGMSTAQAAQGEEATQRVTAVAGEAAAQAAQREEANQRVTAVAGEATAQAAQAAAKTAQGEEEKQRRRAEAAQLVTQALSLVSDQPDLAFLLGLGAKQMDDGVDVRGIGLGSTRPISFLRGYSESVESVAFSPTNGRLLASAGKEENVVLWDPVERRRSDRQITGPTDGLRHVAFSPDGALLAAGGLGGKVVLWDVETRQPTAEQPRAGGRAGVTSVAFNSDGSVLASSSLDGTVRLSGTGARPPPGDPPPFGGPIESIAFQPGGDLLAIGGHDGRVALWNVRTGAPGPAVPRHGNYVRSVAFSPGGRLLAFGGDDGSIVLWDVARGEQRGAPLIGHTNWVWSLAFGPDGNLLASGSSDGTVILWDAATGQRLWPHLTGHRDDVRSVAFSPDGRTMASGSADQTVILWDVAAHRPLTGHTSNVWSVAFRPSSTPGPDGRILASGSGDAGGETSVLLWDTQSRPRPVGTPVPGFAGNARSLAFSPDGLRLAAGGDVGSVLIWDLSTTPPRMRPLPGPADKVRSVAFSQDGRFLAAGGDDGRILLWDVPGGTPLDPLRGHTNIVWAVAFDPVSQTLASGGQDGAIILWDVATRQSRRLGEDLAPVWSIAFSRDGRWLASAGADNNVVLWDVRGQTRTEPPLRGHPDDVWSVAFSPDGRTLASGSQDGTIILWDVATQQPLGRRLTGHRGNVWSVTFSPDGRTLASGSEDRSIILWDVSVLDDTDLPSWQKRACGLANRSLTEPEWRRFVGADRFYRVVCPGPT